MGSTGGVSTRWRSRVTVCGFVVALRRISSGSVPTRRVGASVTTIRSLLADAREVAAGVGRGGGTTANSSGGGGSRLSVFAAWRFVLVAEQADEDERDRGGED